MDRKKFLRNGILGASAAIIGTKVVSAELKAEPKSTYDRLKEQVGFNHLPNKEQKGMQSIFHKSDSRGYANHGWLKSHHTFSFANYYNPERVHFGALRVLNDDAIDGGTGFGRHPHDNMEIISIPLEGDLRHEDSMGTKAVIRHGDIQVMSAGTGVQHSEMNDSTVDPAKFLQIWVFPNKRGVTPRYDQITLDATKMDNQLFQIVSPDEAGEGAWINQNAWFNLGNFDANKEFTYDIHAKENGLYIFLLEGKLTVNGQEMERRDGFGVWEASNFTFKTHENSKVLLMEVPMNV